MLKSLMDGHAPITMHLSLLKSNEKFDWFNFDCLVENRQYFALYGIAIQFCQTIAIPNFCCLWYVAPILMLHMWLENPLGFMYAAISASLK